MYISALRSSHNILYLVCNTSHVYAAAFILFIINVVQKYT